MTINKKRVENSYNLQAKKYDLNVSERFGNSERGVETFTKILLSEVDIPPNPIALDVACGTGLSTFTLYEHCNKNGEFYGIDISQKMIDKANENRDILNYQIEFSKGDAESLKYSDNKFDVIISNYSFQFFPNKLKALTEMNRVIKPDGVLGICFGAGMSQHESFEIFSKVADSENGSSKLREVVKETRLMHISLEDFQDMLIMAGFESPFVFGRHRVIYVNPEQYILTNPYSVDFVNAIPNDFRDSIIREVCDMMRKESEPRGFKITYYTLFGYNKKPSY